jgi:hypothetical protein
MHDEQGSMIYEIQRWTMKKDQMSMNNEQGSIIHEWLTMNNE